MSKIRLKLWPLIVAIVALLAAVAAELVLPKLPATAAIAGWPLALNADYIVLGLGGITLIFGAISFLFRAQKDDTEKAQKPAKVVRDVAPKSSRSRRESTLVEPTAASTGFGSAALEPSTGSTIAPSKADTKAAKARAIEEEKFRKLAAKEAAIAAKKGKRAIKRGKKVEDVQVDDHSTAQISEEDLNAIREHAAANAAYQDFSTTKAENAQGIASDLDDFLVDTNVQTPELENESDVNIEEEMPSWVTAAYDDVTFEIPFANEEVTETPLPSDEELAPAELDITENISDLEIQPEVDHLTEEPFTLEEEASEELPDAAETDFDTDFVSPPADDEIEDQANEEHVADIDDSSSADATGEEIPFETTTPNPEDEALVARISDLILEAQKRAEQTQIADLTRENAELRAKLATLEENASPVNTQVTESTPAFPYLPGLPDDFRATAGSPIVEPVLPVELLVTPTTGKAKKGRNFLGRNRN